jgi:fructose-1,6-bisphosphatase I
MDLMSSVASEEMEHLYEYEDNPVSGKYITFFDPLDGSGNVDVNGPIGSIFSIHRRARTGKASLDEMLRPGTEQIVAGYILYGPATMFVYTAGNAVNGFTLDRRIGEFFLTHPEMKMPDSAGTYSVNEANQHKWNETTRSLVESYRTQQSSCGKRSARYIGALVADFHRTLVHGGIYMYPGEIKKPQGKLRLLYEAAPLAMIAERAGGAASDGQRRILEVVPTELHHRTPLFIGSKSDVAMVEQAYKRAMV